MVKLRVFSYGGRWEIVKKRLFFSKGINLVFSSVWVCWYFWRLVLFVKLVWVMGWIEICFMIILSFFKVRILWWMKLWLILGYWLIRYVIFINFCMSFFFYWLDLFKWILIFFIVFKVSCVWNWGDFIISFELIILKSSREEFVML